MRQLHRGDICIVDFHPLTGHEAAGRRPAVVVMNEAALQTVATSPHAVITVVPLTSSVRTVYPFQVFVPATSSGLRADSKAQAEQVRSVSALRMSPPVGRLPEAELAQLDHALRLHLGL